MKKKKHEEHANHERWLVSYADFITLLFAFFVVMYAVSEVDAQRMKDVVGAIRFAMHFEGTGGVGEPMIFSGPQANQIFVNQHKVKSGGGIPISQRLDLIQIKEKLEERLNSGHMKDEATKSLQLAVTERGLRIRMLDAYFFDPGSSVLRPEAIPIIDSIAAIIKPLKHMIRVEGHSDSEGSGGREEFINWEISTDRSLTIVRYLIEGYRIEPQRLSIGAYAHYRPVATNATEEGRALNRRIDMFVMTSGESVQLQ